MRSVAFPDSVVVRADLDRMSMVRNRVLLACRQYSTRKRVIDESRKQMESDRAKLQWRQDYIERGEWYVPLVIETENTKSGPTPFLPFF